MSPKPNGTYPLLGGAYGHGQEHSPGSKYRIVRHHHMPPDYSHCPPAPFKLRFVALVIDSAIASMLGKVLAIALVRWMPVGQALGISEELVSSWSVILYFTISQSKWGFTVGKRLMHLKVIDARTGRLAHWGRIFYRETIGRMISLLTLGLGYLAAAFGKKLAWHDRIAKTKVVYDKDDTDIAL